MSKKSRGRKKIFRATCFRAQREDTVFYKCFMEIFGTTLRVCVCGGQKNIVGVNDFIKF